MSNQITAFANLTNNSASVVVPGVDLSASGIAAGHGFYRVGEQARYQVASPPTFNGTDTTITLTGNYAGSTASSVEIVIQTSYTSLGFPRLPVLARNGGAVMAYLADVVDSVFQSILDGSREIVTVARRVMTTAKGGTGAEDGANTWVKLATYNLGPSNDNAVFRYALLNAHGGRDLLELTVLIRQGPGLDSANSSVEVVSRNNLSPSVDYNAFRLIAAGTTNNENIELWVKKKSTYGEYRLVEIGRECPDSATITYHDAGAWQSATPTNTVVITSDYGGMAGVVETGSNANGDYIKFADGSVFMWRVLATSSTADVTWTFPISSLTKAVRGGTLTTGITGNASVYFRNDAALTSSAFAGYASDGSRLAMTCNVWAWGTWK